MDLEEVVRTSLKKNPEVNLLGEVFDIKAWIDPFINTLDKISAAHHFW